MDQWYEKYENTKVCHKKIALEAQEKGNWACYVVVTNFPVIKAHQLNFNSEITFSSYMNYLTFHIFSLFDI